MLLKHCVSCFVCLLAAATAAQFGCSSTTTTRSDSGSSGTTFGIAGASAAGGLTGGGTSLSQSLLGGTTSFSNGIGGQAATGGSQSAASLSAKGGTAASGGTSGLAQSLSGGTSGLSIGTGGQVATGGSLATGGQVATGGSLATGGQVATGGSLATGGTSSCSAAFVCGNCLSWNFEGTGDSAAPWRVDLIPNASATSRNGATNALITHSQYQSPTSSLGVPILIDQSTTFTAEIAVAPCGQDTAINLSGYKLTARMLLSGPELTTWSDALQIDTWGPTDTGDYYVLYWGSSPIPTGSWFSITATFSSATPVNRVGLRLSPSSNWVGTMYIDDVVISLAL